MLSRGCSALFLLLTWGSTIVTAQSPHLCDECECLPSREAPETVNCMCEHRKILIFQDHFTDIMSRTTHLNISSCSFLSLPVAGFAKAPSLHNVQIKNLGLFHLAPRVFPNLKRLYIDNVTNLILNSFTGLPQFESLIVLRSKLNELSTDSFQSISTMSEILLNQVYVGKIFSHGVDADFGYDEMSGRSQGVSSFTIQSSKISEIDSSALNLAGLNLFQLINSTVETIRDSGLNISANVVNIISNRFGLQLNEHAFVFSSNYVQMTYNEFNFLPNNILSNIVTPNKITFQYNIIFDVDLGGFLLNLDYGYINIKYNKILCNCEPNKVSFLKLNYNFPGIQITNETEIIRDNFCLTYDQISLYLFKEYLVNGSMCGQDQLSQRNETLDLETSSTHLGYNLTRGSVSGAGSGQAGLERIGLLLGTAYVVGVLRFF